MDFNDFTVFDTETTGFLPNGRVIEIGAARFIDGLKVGTFQMVIKQPEPQTEKEKNALYHALQVNNITPEMIARGFEEEMAFRLFANFCRGSILVAHNYPFDGGMLNEFYTRVVGKEHYAPALCTLSLCRFLKIAPKNGLGDVCKEVGITIEEQHRALGDAEATARLFFNHLLPKIDIEEHVNNFGVTKGSKHSSQLSIKYEYFAH